MPKELEDKLKKTAKKKGLKGDRADAYVYGTLNKLKPPGGWKEDLKGHMKKGK